MLSYFPAFFLLSFFLSQKTHLWSLFHLTDFEYLIIPCSLPTALLWNHDETMMTYTEDMAHVTTPWLDRFCIFNAHAFTAITFLTIMTLLLCLLFSLTVSTIPFLMSVTFPLQFICTPGNPLLQLTGLWIFNYFYAPTTSDCRRLPKTSDDLLPHLHHNGCWIDPWCCF